MGPLKRVRKGSKEPTYSAFSQQELIAYKPVFTPRKAIASFLIIGFVFIPIGAILLAASRSVRLQLCICYHKSVPSIAPSEVGALLKNKVIEVSARYDDVCISGSGTNAEREARLMQAYEDESRTEQLLSCDAPPTLTIPYHMKAPVFIYYELNSFHQNHRRYVKSRSDAQLRGDVASASSLASCEPEQYSDAENDTGLITPCGLMAWSFFNDTYSIRTETPFVKLKSKALDLSSILNPSNVYADLVMRPREIGHCVRDLDIVALLKHHNNRMPSCSLWTEQLVVDMRTSSTAKAVTLPIAEDGIAWRSDVDQKFSESNVTHFNDDPNTRGGGTIKGSLKADEHFIVWMRNAVLPNFRKLWGRIDTDIPANAIIRVNIQNRYNTYRFNGKKRVVLSTTSWMGGRNDFLGLAYISVGSASILLGFVFAAIGWRWPRNLGDVSLLSWNALDKNQIRQR